MLLGALAAVAGTIAGMELAFRSELRLSPFQLAFLKLKAIRVRVLIERILRQEVDKDD